MKIFNTIKELFKYIFLLTVVLTCGAFLILGIGLLFGIIVSLVKFGYVLGMWLV